MQDIGKSAMFLSLGHFHSYKKSFRLMAVEESTKILPLSQQAKEPVKLLVDVVGIIPLILQDFQ